MHLTLLFGGVPVALLGQPVAAVALLVVLKTGVDAWSHLREHRTERIDGPAGAAAMPETP